MYGDALLQSQQIERAIPILERAVTAQGCPGRGTRLAGRAYVQAGRYQEALPHLAVAGERGRGMRDAHLQLARAYQALGRPADAQKAMAEYQKRHQRTGPERRTPEKALTPPKNVARLRCSRSGSVTVSMPIRRHVIEHLFDAARPRTSISRSTRPCRGRNARRIAGRGVAHARSHRICLGPQVDPRADALAGAFAPSSRSVSQPLSALLTLWSSCGRSPSTVTTNRGGRRRRNRRRRCRGGRAPR